MPGERGRAKAQRQTAKFTEQFRHAKKKGYNITTMGLPTYETQEDFDQYRPEAPAATSSTKTNSSQ